MTSPYAVQLVQPRSAWHASTLKPLARSVTPAGHSLRRSISREERRVDVVPDMACKAKPVQLLLIPPPANPTAVPCVARPRIPSCHSRRCGAVGAPSMLHHGTCVVRCRCVTCSSTSVSAPEA